ncbi:hypothetical protein A3860_11805 [Niastella vici]|uniref:DUF1622 domain-containing protein n=1 Tax=Niastella vici TaxID=1703345 RepID=A0A1V9FG25_9BACT|nr:hypothetical protein A3860_11805 [Niastella vici]
MEQTAKLCTIYVGHAVETLAAFIIGLAVVKVMCHYTLTLFSKKGSFSKEAIRVQFGSSVAVSLEMLLGADVLATAVAPGWDAIGKLAAIAVIRTALNYFLGKELNHMPATPENYQ